MKIAIRLFIVAALAALFVPALHAATYFVPTDAELIQKADDIVVATGVASKVERDARGSIITRYTLRIDEVLKGERAAGHELELVERGGILDGKLQWIFGTPEYEPGVRYLVFTDANRDGEATTLSMAIGQFFFAEEKEHSLLLRAEVVGFDQNLDPHVERARDARGFVEYIRGIVAQTIDPEPRYFIDKVNAEYTPSSEWKVGSNASRATYLMSASGRAFRWSDPTASFVKSGTAAGGATAVSVAFSEWNNTASTINYTDAGQDNTALGGLATEDNKNAILFGDPNGEINGAAGIGGISAGGAPYELGGENFWDMFEVDVVIENTAFSQSCLNSVMTHEVGHTLGFRHSNQPPAGGDNTTDAIMNSSVNCAWNGVLKTYDHTAAETVYGSGPVCNPPSIVTQPQNRNIGLGASTSLSVSASGTAPMNYQWYIGASGVITTPVPGATSNTLNVNGTTVGVTSYWVRVSNACGSPADSAAATVTVTCTAPTIVAQPQGANISLGGAATLSVTATGATSYQWYFGNSGDTSQPITGATTNALNVNGSAVGSQNYWVRISNSCGEVNSNTVTVNVTCTAPSILSNPGNTSIVEGQSAQLQVTANGSGLTYQWYVGTTGDTSTPIGGNSRTLNVTPAVTTSFWVRVSGACGSPVNSATVTVTVIPCADLTVDAPTSTPLTTPGSHRLSVTATSTAMPLVYEWYRGTTPGFGGTKVGSTASINVTVTAVTSYWAFVTNSCNRSVASSLITVAPCTLPVITTQPEDKNIQFGQSATLTIGSSTAGITVKWYRGALGDKSNEAGTGTTFTTPTLTATTQYWAEVSNSCGPVSSRQVTVTVQQTTDRLPMLNQRFTVEVFYTNQFENPPVTGKLIGRSLASSNMSDTAVFTFNDPLTIELMVRLSDARPFENKVHVFYGGLSDVEFSIRVTDSVTGVSRDYAKPPNQLVGQIDRTTFTADPTAGVMSTAVNALMASTVTRGITTNEDTSTLRMLNNRYQVRVRYRNQFVNPPVEGYLLGRSIASSSLTETAVFFVESQSVEWMVRFSDARPFANRIDFFHGGLSDLQFTIEVTDTTTGQTKEYVKAPFSLNGLVDRQTWQP